MPGRLKRAGGRRAHPFKGPGEEDAAEQMPDWPSLGLLISKMGLIILLC